MVSCFNNKVGTFSYVERIYFLRYYLSEKKSIDSFLLATRKKVFYQLWTSHGDTSWNGKQFLVSALVYHSKNNLLFLLTPITSFSLQKIIHLGS